MSNIKIMNKGEKYAHATIGCIKVLKASSL